MLAKLRAPGAPWEDVTYSERTYLDTTLSIPDGTTDAPAYAFDDDALILTSHVELLERVIDTHRGTTQSLATGASFQETEAELPEGRLMLAFIDTGSLQAELEDAFATGAAASIGGLGDLRAVDGVGISMSAEPNGVAFDVVASFDAANLTGSLREQVMAPDHENVLLPSVPEDAWGVFGAQHLQFGIQEAIDELESQDPGIAADLRDIGLTGGNGLLDLLTGDIAVSVSPDETTTVGGALLLRVSDDDAAGTAVERVATSAAGLGVSDLRPEDVPQLEWRSRTGADGTEITYLTELPIAYALRDGMLVIGSSVEQVDDVLAAENDGSLIDDPAYLRGIRGVPATDMLFYLDVGRVVTSIEEALPVEERASFREDVGADLRAVRSVAFGMDANETRQRSRMFVAVDVDDEVTS
jgi:hypothetical protein